jgi:hypothetical protein
LLKNLARTPARLALPAVLLVCATGAASAQQPQPAAQDQQQREHVVRRGDTLWDLARTYLQNPFSWPLIYEANRNVVQDPHWIYPANRLIIPPALQQRASGGPIGMPAAMEQAAPFVPAPPAAAADQAQPTTQPTLISTVDLRRPVVSPGEYRRAPWLGAPVQAAPAARITRKVDPSAQSDRLYSVVLPNERVFVTAPGAGVGDSLLVVRPGAVVGEWGQIMVPLAIVRVDSVYPQQALGRVVAQFGEARVGDMVLPMGAEPMMPAGEATDVTAGPTGVLLRFLTQQPLYGNTDLGFISLGHADGVGIGDEFGVYVPADATAPAVRVGVLRVIRVTDRSATVRVVGATSTALRDGLPVPLIRRMP